MKRIVLAALIFLLFLTGTAGADTDAAQVSVQAAARAAALIDARSGRILYAHNENTLLPIASVTKIMTALLAVEKCDMGETVTASENASGVTGSSIYLGVGETLSMRQMLLGLMLRSGNDAAVAIAEHVAGDVESFAVLMNQRAEQLGATAHFVTPNGLDEGGNGASALGVALIAREAMRNQTFRELVSTTRAVIPWRDSQYDRVLTNKNRLLRDYPGATGIKTGYTQKAGRCLAFSAQRDGMELIGVVLGCGNWFNEAASLLDWGFANYEEVHPLSAGDTATQIPVTGGTQDSVCLTAAGSLCAPVKTGEAWAMRLDVPENIKAPVAAGQPVGRAYIELEGNVFTQVDLIAGEDVPKWNFWEALKKTLRFWQS